MKPERLTGTDAGVLKYDLLTALSVLALTGTATFQMSILRLIALITARYNWRADEFSVGQREMARMWSVNERTVKREMKRLIDAQILICKRGGVRGRVGAYTLNYRQIADMSQSTWPLVGPDFDARMQDRYRRTESKVVQMQAFVKPKAAQAKDGTWQRALEELAKTDPNMVNSWFSRLTFHRFEHGRLHLSAPSSFVQRYIETHLMRILVTTAEQELGPIDQIVFDVPA